MEEERVYEKCSSLMEEIVELEMKIASSRTEQKDLRKKYNEKLIEKEQFKDIYLEMEIKIIELKLKQLKLKVEFKKEVRKYDDLPQNDESTDESTEENTEESTEESTEE